MVVERYIFILNESAVLSLDRQFIDEIRAGQLHVPEVLVRTLGPESKLGLLQQTSCVEVPLHHRLIKIITPFFDLLFYGIYDICVRKPGS